MDPPSPSLIHWVWSSVVGLGKLHRFRIQVSPWLDESQPQLDNLHKEGMMMKPLKMELVHNTCIYTHIRTHAHNTHPHMVHIPR